VELVDAVEPVALGEEVGDDQDPHAGVATGLAHLPEVEVGLPVEAAVGLVEEEQLRFVHQREREVELLAGSARELLDPIAVVAAEPQLLHQFVGSGPGGLVVEGVSAGEELEVLVDRELVPQHRYLGQ
jgi:hypothetical protein